MSPLDFFKGLMSSEEYIRILLLGMSSYLNNLKDSSHTSYSMTVVTWLIFRQTKCEKYKKRSGARYSKVEW